MNIRWLLNTLIATSILTIPAVSAETQALAEPNQAKATNTAAEKPQATAGVKPAPTPKAKPQSMVDIMALALKNDPTLAQAQAQLLQVGELKPQSRAVLLPAIGLDGEAGWNRTDVTDSAFFPNNRSSSVAYSLRLNITQPLFNFEAFERIRQVDYQLAEAKASYAIAEQNVLARVAQAYVHYLEARDDVTLAIAEKSAISKQLEQAQERFNVGLSAITEKQEAQARYDLIIADEIQAERVLYAAESELSELTGTHDFNLFGLSPSLKAPMPEPANVDHWVHTAKLKNLTVLLRRTQRDVARTGIGVADSKHYPVVNLVASHSYSDTTDDPFGRKANDSKIALQVNVPLYQGGLVDSQTQQAVYAHDEAKFAVKVAERNAERSTRDAYYGVTTSLAQIKALGQAVKSSEIALQATQAGFEVGNRTSVDVLNAERDMFRARRNLEFARYAYLTESLRLRLATGTFGREDIQHNSAVFNVPPAQAGAHLRKAVEPVTTY